MLAGRAGGRGSLAVPLVLVVLAAVTRLWDLGHPGRIYFDETYYAQDALDILRRGVEEGRAVHPPVGKWPIALGLEVVGVEPLGWRVGVALTGVVTVLATYALGRRLAGSVAVGGLAGLLVVADGLALTTSRIAMLDATLTMLVVLAVWLLVVDLDQRAGRGWHLPGARWWAGICLGLAVGTKWSGLLALGGAVAVALVADAVRRTGPGAPLRARLHALPRVAAGVALPLVAVPALTYVASHASWAVHVDRSYSAQAVCDPGECDLGPAQTAALWWDYQLELVDYHGDLEATHPYRSSPWTWPVVSRPVLVYLEACPEQPAADEECATEPGSREVIRSQGNPAVWWPALLAYPFLAWRALRRRDRAAGVVLAMLLAQFVPWLLAPRPGYLFYMAPAVPFVALALALAAVHVARRSARLRWVPWAVALVAVAGLVFFWPVWTGVPLSETEHDRRVWIDSWR